MSPSSRQCKLRRASRSLGEALVFLINWVDADGIISLCNPHLGHSCEAWSCRSHLVAMQGHAITLKIIEQPDKNRREVEPCCIIKPLNHPSWTASLWTPCNVRELKIFITLSLIFVPERMSPPSHVFSGFPNTSCYSEANLYMVPRIMSGP